MERSGKIDYHATAVETGEHVARCVVYIDQNMAPAGVVAHPREWPAGGYHEIQEARPSGTASWIARPRPRYSASSPCRGLSPFTSNGSSLGCVPAAHARVPEWSESVAVGGRAFVASVAAELGVRAAHRQIETCGDLNVFKTQARLTGVIWQREYGL